MTPLRISFLTWRDAGHPDGGGSEVYVEEIARRLAGLGHEMTIFCSRYPGSRSREVVDGVTYRRAGGRLGVYLRGLAFVAGREGRRQDVVVDVINGLPFGARLVRHRGLLALVHHVHRAQWEIIYPGWRGRLGWFVESRLTPALYRSTTHVTVSDATRRDLEGLGIPPARVTVVRNGLDQAPHLEMFAHSPEPRLCVLSRLVPHKQIEHALEVTARLAPAFPGLHLDVVGDGWWARQLIGAATGLGDIVTFHGHVDPRTRDRLLAEAWVLLLPSVKEGWGLAVMEGAAQGTPAVCYRYAGGVNESVVSGVTGLLVDDLDAMVDATARLLGDDALRARMSAAAALRARDFSWDETARAFEEVLVAQLPVSADRR